MVVVSPLCVLLIRVRHVLGVLLAGGGDTAPLLEIPPPHVSQMALIAQLARYTAGDRAARAALPVAADIIVAVPDGYP
jgi:hypothetical protein